MATKFITIKLMVDKTRNRVVFAESNNDFVEILLSFLTLPLGSIMRLTSKQPMGSLHKLFDSVEKLDSGCLVNEACRSMLLSPINYADKQCSALPVIYDDNCSSLCYGFICSNPSCCYGGVSLYPNAPCGCGEAMDIRVKLASPARPSKKEEAYVFIISDDLFISQSSTERIIDLLREQDSQQQDALESIQVNVTAEKIIELLKRLLISDTPLTDVFLFRQNENKTQSFKQPSCKIKDEIVESISAKKIPVKLILNKDDNKLLFAEGDEEFVDLLVSFLTYPMICVVHKLGGKSGIQCFDNLYKWVEYLRSAKCFERTELIEILLRPNLPPYSRLGNQLIKLDELTVNRKFYSCRTYQCGYDKLSSIPNIKCMGCGMITNRRFDCTSPKSGGFMMSSRFMVTDDLIMKNFSPIMVATEFLQEPGRITARNVEIGENEALGLLRACITTENVLTDALLGEEWRRSSLA